jgi:hypothetical protein
MATAETSRVQCVTKSQFNPASLTSSYQALNGTGFSDTVKVLKIYNPSTTVSIDVSFDGVTDHDFIPPLATLIIDFQANHYDGPTFASGQWNVAQYQILYGKTASQPTYLQIIGYR